MCGILALISKQARSDLGHIAATGIIPLEGRGQDGFGAVGHRKGSDHLAYDRRSTDNQIIIPNDPVTHVLFQTRYSTIGADSDESRQAALQPYISTSPTFVFAHNGQVGNMITLEQKIKERNKGWIPQTGSDVETLARALALNLEGNNEVNEQAFAAFKAIADETSELYANGGYAGLMLLPNQGLLAFRDAKGVRDLWMATCEKTGIIGFASETISFQTMNKQHYTHFKPLKIQPGEAIFVNEEIHNYRIGNEPEGSCTFEDTYQSNAASISITSGMSVLKTREKIGWQLFQEKSSPISQQTRIVGVPDSGRSAARGYALAAATEHGMPELMPTESLLRNRYTSKRAFITKESDRQATIRDKFWFAEDEVNGYDMVIIDDSLVRGDTMKYLVKKLKEYGARSVHVRIAFPEVRYNCPAGGADTSDPTRLIAYNNKSNEDIRKEIGADSLGYISENGYRKASRNPHGCMGCHTGKYLTRDSDLHEYRELRVIS